MIKTRTRISTFVFWLWLGVTLSSALGEDIEFSADSVESYFTEGRESVQLQGNAFIRTDRVEIRAQEIVLSGTNNRFVTATGSVFVYERQKDLRLTGDELSYDRTFDILRVRGNGVLEDRQNDIVARGSLIENRGDDLSLIQIGVRILRPDLSARADLVRYDRQGRILELTGQPVVYSDGDEFRAARILVDLDTDDIRLEGGVQGRIMDENDG
ncbi:MAG: hypothetical protein GW949_10485 [Spirochaetales bacterium]|nr:hypothetical protein [Spirochaetales bacterium]